MGNPSHPHHFLEVHGNITYLNSMMCSTLQRVTHVHQTQIHSREVYQRWFKKGSTLIPILGTHYGVMTIMYVSPQASPPPHFTLTILMGLELTIVETSLEFLLDHQDCTNYWQPLATCDHIHCYSCNPPRLIWAIFFLVKLGLTISHGGPSLKFQA